LDSKKGNARVREYAAKVSINSVKRGEKSFGKRRFAIEIAIETRKQKENVTIWRGQPFTKAVTVHAQDEGPKEKLAALTSCDKPELPNVPLPKSEERVGKEMLRSPGEWLPKEP